MIFKRLAVLLLCGVAHVAHAGLNFRIADFETSNGCTISADVGVTGSLLVQTTNVLDSSKALQFNAGLNGRNAGWAGISVSVSTGTIAAAADHILLDARAEGRSHGIFVTLTESDGSRWNANIRVSGTWKHYELPVYQFTWFSGPESRRNSRPHLAELRSIDLWVGSTFQGTNGFAVDNVIADDRVPSFAMKLQHPNEVRQQRETTLTLVAFGENGNPAEFNGEVWLEIPDRNDALLPKSIRLKNGRGEFAIFPRTAETLELHAIEPVSDQDLVTSLTVVPADVAVHLDVFQFQGEQVMYANETLAPHLAIAGNAVPLSAHIEVTNHLGRRLFSTFYSVADLHADHGKIMITEPGPMNVRVRAVAEPMSNLPHINDNMPLRLTDPLSTQSTRALPDGVTSSTSLVYQLTLEDLPSTATVIGEDRFPLLVLTEIPREIYFNKWFFGICGGALFHLDANDIPTTGAKRLKWQQKLGSGWGRNDFWWHAVQPIKGSWAWQKANAVVQRYKDHRQRLLGVMAYESAWSQGKAPADAESRAEWKEFVRKSNEQFPGVFYGFEVWNEPNHGFWKPKPDATAYRELVKTTWEAVRTSGTQEVPGPRVVAGATAGFDPVFLSKLIEDDYPRFWDALSMHPYAEALTKSPEENSLPEILDEAQALLRGKGLKKELWITEIGWPTGPAGVTESEQANYLIRSMTIAMHKGVDKLFWYNLYDWTPWFRHEDFGAHTGLLDSNYHPKPAAAAYNIATFMMATMNAREKTQQGSASIYSFEIERQSVKYEGKMHVAWTPSEGDEQDIELPIVMNGSVFAIDYLGAEREAKLIRTEKADRTTTLSANDAETSMTAVEDGPSTATYRFHITHEPLYIWDNPIPRVARLKRP